MICLDAFPLPTCLKRSQLSGHDRRFFLEEFVRQFIRASYQPTRDSAHMIYGVEEPLIHIAPEPWSAIELHIKNICDPRILEMNLTASKLLFDFVRERNYRATYYPVQDFYVGPHRSVPIGISFYVTEGDRLLFHFPHPRHNSLSDRAVQILGSIMYHAYAQGDYENAEIEVIDLGCPPKSKQRQPRIRYIPRDKILDLSKLKEEIQTVYALLWELATKRP